MFELDELLKMGANKKNNIYANAIPSGARIGNSDFICIKTLHRGEMTFTYLAKHSADRTQVVIKEFFPRGNFTYEDVKMSLCRDDHLNLLLEEPSPEGMRTFHTLKTRFKDETRCLMKLKDRKHVVDVFEGFETQGTSYRVMTYLAYPSLNQYLNEKILMPKVALGLYKNILKAVKNLHMQGIAHKGLDPKGIFLTDTEIILNDFSMLRDGKDLTFKNSVDNRFSDKEEKLVNEYGRDIYSLGLILEVILESIGYKQDKTHNIAMGRAFESVPLDYYLEQTTIIDGTSSIKTIDDCISMITPSVEAKKVKRHVLHYIIALVLVTIACFMVYTEFLKPADKENNILNEVGNIEIVFHSKES